MAETQQKSTPQAPSPAPSLLRHLGIERKEYRKVGTPELIQAQQDAYHDKRDLSKKLGMTPERALEIFDEAVQMARDGDRTRYDGLEKDLIELAKLERRYLDLWDELGPRVGRAMPRQA